MTWAIGYDSEWNRDIGYGVTNIISTSEYEIVNIKLRKNLGN